MISEEIDRLSRNVVEKAQNVNEVRYLAVLYYVKYMGSRILYADWIIRILTAKNVNDFKLHC